MEIAHRARLTAVHIALLMWVGALAGLVAACSGGGGGNGNSAPMSNSTSPQATPTTTATPTASATPTATITPPPVLTSSAAGAAASEIENSILTFGAALQPHAIKGYFKEVPHLGAQARQAFVQRRVERSLAKALQSFGLGSPEQVYSKKAVADFRQAITTAASALSQLELSGAAGDTKDELPRGCSGLTDGPCTAGADSLVIKFWNSKPTSGTTSPLVVLTFDWTGASTGTASPTVQAQDPANPSVTFELPTKVVVTLTVDGQTVINAIVSVSWHPSSCDSTKVLVDIPDSASGVAQLTNPETGAQVSASATGFQFTGDNTFTARTTFQATGAGKTIETTDNVVATGQVVRSSSLCNGVVDYQLTSVSGTGAISDTVHSIQAAFNADGIVIGSQGTPNAADVTGALAVDNQAAPVSGEFNNTDGDTIPGENLSLGFAGAPRSFEQFLVDELGIHAHGRPRAAPFHHPFHPPNRP